MTEFRVYAPCKSCREPATDMLYSEWDDEWKGWRQFGYCKDCQPRSLRAYIWNRQLRIGRWWATLLGFGKGYSGCQKCRTPWDLVRHHDTSYSDSRGCFPLCEKCWSELTPECRLPYYKKLHDEWKRQGSEQPWAEIERAVLAGK